MHGAHLLDELGVKFYATGGTADFLSDNGLNPEVVHWPLEETYPNALDLLKAREVDLVINIPKDFRKEELTNDYIIRRTAVDFGIPLITNLQLAQRLAESLHKIPIDQLKAQSWSSYK